jgi:hypothetical protein
MLVGPPVRRFLWDQTVAAWLGCQRTAFKWFGAMPERLIIEKSSAP